MSNEEVIKMIGANVKRYRKEKKYTQGKLAEEARVDRTTISKLENGKFLPTLELLLSISRVLNVEIICLFIGVRIF